MDLLTPMGFLCGALVMLWGINEGHALGSFMNSHGIIIVIGGTLAATMINCSAREMRATFRAFLSLFRKPKTPPPDKMVAFLTEVCREARRSGLKAIQDVGTRADDDGFVSRALDVSLGAGDLNAARDALEREINNVRFRHRETANIFRTMGTLAPMFGLLGTLIGIVSVLRSLTDPATVGGAMAVAISSAFYGIVFSNLLCVPAAGKLRMRSLDEATSKELVMVGILDIVFTQKAPTVVELTLRAFLHEKPQQER